MCRVSCLQLCSRPKLHWLAHYWLKLTDDRIAAPCKLGLALRVVLLDGAAALGDGCLRVFETLQLVFEVLVDDVLLEIFYV